MTSVASFGTAERITLRTFFKVLRAGSGTRARYSSTLAGGAIFFAEEDRARETAFFIRENNSNSVASCSAILAALGSLEAGQGDIRDRVPGVVNADEEQQQRIRTHHEQCRTRMPGQGYGCRK